MKSDDNAKYIPVILNLSDGEQKWATENIANNDIFKNEHIFLNCVGPFAEGEALKELEERFDRMTFSTARKDVIQAWIIREDEKGERTARMVCEQPMYETEDFDKYITGEEFHTLYEYNWYFTAIANDWDLTDYWMATEEGARLDIDRVLEDFAKDEKEEAPAH